MPSRVIERTLRMSYETFTNSSFIQQGRADSLRVDAIAFAEFCAKHGMCTFLVVIHGFANIVQDIKASIQHPGQLSYYQITPLRATTVGSP